MFWSHEFLFRHNKSLIWLLVVAFFLQTFFFSYLWFIHCVYLFSFEIRKICSFSDYIYTRAVEKQINSIVVCGEWKNVPKDEKQKCKFKWILAPCCELLVFNVIWLHDNHYHHYALECLHSSLFWYICTYAQQQMS